MNVDVYSESSALGEEDKEDENEKNSNKHIKTQNLDDAQQIWYNQISKQITTMSRTVHENSEQETGVQFFIDETDLNSQSTVNVVESRPDGNCMLSSIAHPLSYCKMNSSEHES